MNFFLEALFWLTLNVYHEARSEPEIGKLAVAEVTINRAKKDKKSIVAVVTKPKQFSWTSTQKRYLPDNWAEFISCGKTVIKALILPDITRGALYYHRYDVHPYWADKLKYVGQFGSHLFYKDK